MKRVRTLAVTLVLGAAFATFMTGCGGEANSQSMEQLRASQGVPVKTEIVRPATFVQGLEYNSVITGIEESSAITSLTDRVETINYRIGDRVEKDAVVLTFPTDNPTAQYYQAKLTFENAEASFRRMESFYRTGGLSRQDFDNAETAFRVAEADWNSIRQAVEVKAPISGIITSINVRETENVNKDDELFTIARTDRVKSRVWVAGRDIDRVSIGQDATALWNGQMLDGKVVQVDLSMNQARKAFAVDVQFDNTEQLVRTGVTARITLETFRSESAIFIERKNIIREDTNQYVFLNRSGAAHKEAVTTGMVSGMDVEIVGGLESGDELIVEGQMLLSENTKLNLITE